MAGASTAVLNYSANERKGKLLDKLGGQHVLHEAVEKFYEKLLQDESIKPFFLNSNVQLLKWHQFNFMSIAFAQVPPNFDVARLILEKHESLFDNGLNETHFDVVLSLFQGTLNDLKIHEEIIQDAVSVLKPLRDDFEQGAVKSKARRKNHTIVHVLHVAAILFLLSYGFQHIWRGAKRV